MAKEIKAIKCPQCGSTDKTEIRTDFYRCNSCQTEYFLDDNDVTINYNHNYNNNNSSFNAGGSKKTITIVAVVLGVFIFMSILINVLSSIFSHSNPSPASTYAVPEREEEKGFSASRYNSTFFIQPETLKPIVLIIETRNYKAQSEEQKDGVYFAFYDPLEKKLLAEQKIPGLAESMIAINLKVRTFSDGNIYTIIDKSALFMVDKVSLKVIEAGKKFFSAQPKLQIGVATMEFVYSDYGDGLILLTNDGNNLYYYPLVQKLYSKDQFYTALIGFNTLLPGAQVKTINVFTGASSSYPDEKLQLLKIKYKDNGAGPKDLPDNISWGKDYGGAGLFTERDPYRKVLFDNYALQRGRILEWKDLTPGRLYFAPSVLDEYGDKILIRLRADANQKSNYKLQQLNAVTGAVDWTTDLTAENTVSWAYRYKNGFIGMTSNDEMIIFDVNGKIKGNYKIE